MRELLWTVGIGSSFGGRSAWDGESIVSASSGTTIRPAEYPAGALQAEEVSDPHGRRGRLMETGLSMGEENAAWMF
jgi:hypothetical protein